MLLICASHSPLQLTDIEATDAEKHRRYFATLEGCADQVESYSPDFIVVFAPDHFNGLFYDLMPSFCIGVKAESTEDWGIQHVTLKVPHEAEECVRSVMKAGLDVAISHRLRVDHGTTIPLIRLRAMGSQHSVLPIVINCAADPRPSFRRVREFGTAVGSFLKKSKKRVVIVGSGGLSHDPPTPRLAQSAGSVAERLINRHTPTKLDLERRQSRVMEACRALVRGGGPMLPPSEAWDAGFIETFLEQKLEAFDEWTDKELDETAGFGGHEVRCWIAAAAAMRAAGDFTVTKQFYAVVPEWATGMAVVTGQHATQ